MTVLADSAIEFRCKKCWQQIYAPVESASTQIECPHCESATDVPEASEQNLCSVEKLREQQNQLIEEEEPQLEDLTPQELQRLALEESQLPLNEMEFAGHSDASLLARLGGALVDFFYSCLLISFGIIGNFAALKTGRVPCKYFRGDSGA